MLILISEDVDISKCISDYVYIIDCITISQIFKFYKCVFLLIIEAEYMVMSDIGREIVWLKDFLEEIGKK